MSQCPNNYGSECLGLAKAESLEKQLNQMKESSTATHKEMFDRIRKLEDDRTELKTRYESIDTSLKAMREDLEVIKGKPSNLIDDAKVAAIGVVVGYLLKGIGIF